MAKQRITIRDIAAAADVSTSAVSYVLNNRKGVSEETRARIRKIIERYGYQPNLNSVRLVSRRSFNIRIAIQNRSSPFHDFFFYEIAQGVVEGSSRVGYNIVFSNLSGEGGADSFLRSIEGSDIDGIIFFLDVDPQLLYRVREAQIPAVVIDGHQTESSVTQVRADYSVAAEKAAAHLISLGHSDIALIGSNTLTGYFDQVFAGFQQAFQKATLTSRVAWVQSWVDSEEEARASVAELISQKPAPKAIVCASDLIAVGAIQAVKARGLRCPEHVSVIGIDDIVLSRYIEPALTTIRIDKTHMGRIAVDLLLDLIAGKEAKSVVVPSDRLIERASTATPFKNATKLFRGP